MRDALTVGSTTVESRLFRVVTESGAPITAALPGDFVIKYRRSDMTSATTITTVSATRGTPVQSGLVVDDEDASVYELGLPNAAKTSGRWVIISWSGTGILADSMLFDLIALDRWNSQTAGLDTMADLLDDGRIDLLIDGLVTGVTVSAIDEDAITASALAAGAVTEIQSGLGTAANQSTIASYIDTEIAALTTAVAGLNDLSAADVNTQVNTALSNYGGLKTGVEYVHTQNSANESSKTANVTITEA